MCRIGRTSVQTAIRADELLQRAGGRALGIVLIGVPKPPSQWRYYYEPEHTDEPVVPVATNGQYANGHEPGTNGSAAPSEPAVEVEAGAEAEAEPEVAVVVPAPPADTPPAPPSPFSAPEPAPPVANDMTTQPESTAGLATPLDRVFDAESGTYRLPPDKRWPREF